MNRSVILRPLAIVAVLALVAVGLQRTGAALPQASSLLRVTTLHTSSQPHVAPPATSRPRVSLHTSSRLHVIPHAGGLSGVATQALSLPASLRGTLVALHRAQRTGVLAVANGHLFPLRFASVAQVQRLRVGSRLTVSGDARPHVRLPVRALRTEGVGTRTHIRGIVARRLGRGAVEVLGVNGAAVVLHLGHAHVTRVHNTAALGAATLASADNGPAIAPGEEMDTAVTLTGEGAVAMGTATVAAPRAAQVEVEGLITAVGRGAGTLTIQDEDGLTTVVSVGTAASTYHVGQEVEVVGALTGAGGSAAMVQGHVVRLEEPVGAVAAPKVQVVAEPTEVAEAAEPTKAPEAAEPTEAAEAPEAAEPTEAAEAPETAEPTEVSEAAEPTEAPEAAEPTEAAEAPEVAEPTEAPEAAEPTEAVDASEAAEPTEAAEAPHAAEPTEVPEATEGPGGGDDGSDDGD